MHLIKILIASLSFIVIFFFGVTTAVSGEPPTIQRMQEDPESDLKSAIVKKVIDGDSVLLSNGEQVRYLGIDTPEFGEPFFEKAKEANRELVEGKSVKLAVCVSQPRDKYNRFLAYVSAGPLKVNEELLERGLARTLNIPPCGAPRAKQFRSLEREAFRDRRGLWSLQKQREVSHEKAGRFIGKLMIVNGTVLNVHKGEKAIHLNFGEDYRTDFTATIFRKDLSSLQGQGMKPVEEFRNRKVAVTGYIKKYMGSEIIIESMDQIILTDY